MDNDGSLFSAVFAAVIQIEAHRELEIELNSSALKGTTESVVNRNIDFWSIKGSVAGI